MTMDVNKGPKLGMRHMQAFLIFSNIVVVYISRLNIGVAVVAMTHAATTNPDFPEYDWNEKEVSYVLSSFYWGYVLTQFLGGALCKRFGAKTIIGWSTFSTALLSAITPWSISWGGWQAFCIIRAVQGLFQGTIFPCIHTHLAKWSPLEERTRLGALSFTGIDCGSVLSLGIGGIIAEGPMGWPGISYISGGLCFLWCIFWYIYSADNVRMSQFATEAEKTYIESSMDRSDDFHKKHIPTPWKAIFLSLPFNAFMIARCGEAWGLSILQVQIPLYMNSVLQMNIKANALFTALPFLVMFIFSYIFVFIADLFQRKQILSLWTIRRTFNTIAFCTPAIGLTAIGFLDVPHKSWALVIMAVCGGVNSGQTIGSVLNTIDLSANHAGMLMGIVNTAQNFMPLITPIIVGYVVTDEHNRSQWQIVFIMAAAVFFFSNLFYILCGTSTTQPWDAEDFLQPKDPEIRKHPYGKTRKFYRTTGSIEITKVG
ncbi:putative inorganic phosphate cotransporter [Haematobia irritans]|uniref:putative inorganic phosphate cotransporter n=1 Tax=Haematobia irritans TaxID=7368 RepID=UPI003F5044A4